METGWIVSLIVAGVIMVVILAIMIPMDRKHVVREYGKINFKKLFNYYYSCKEFSYFSCDTICCIFNEEYESPFFKKESP